MSFVRVLAALSGLALVTLQTPPAAAAASSAPAMLTPGKFSVNDRGAFTYTIPIAVPPGTAGMVPALSLNYDSQTGDGLEGIGWSLQGLPSVGRCPRTLARIKSTAASTSTPTTASAWRARGSS
ncbi:MAG: SpvB/TcaC N-terminal domain-containing protein [Caulobacteraceae bacterium]